ncbi:hypothetical protein [Sphingobacterium corticibacter]|uniref:hypothetical protein n=1 Tax=Sphingobacterium corticibacter TaxID=2171749 RepID=UPI0013FE3406|nr:hypothetical protein [Sphingobacterium corticibacter]
MWYLIFLLMIGQGGQTTPTTGPDGQVTIQNTDGDGDGGEAGTILPPKPPVKP